MCKREIGHYRRLDKEGRIDWVDASRDSDRLAQAGLTLETAMTRFHVRTADGSFKTGAFGFAEMWRHLPYYRHLSRFLEMIRALPMLDLFYGRFAAWRLRRRDGAVCSPERGCGR